MSSELDLLKKIYAEFEIKDEEVIIDIFCIIKQLEGYKPKAIKLLFEKELPEAISENNADYIYNFINDTNKFGILMRKYKRSGIISLFRSREDFLYAFLKHSPSPQDVGLPFRDWDAEILQHYILIVYKMEIAYSTFKKILRTYSPQKSLPFLARSRKLNSKKHALYLWNIRFFSLTEKFSHFVPIRLNGKDIYETNCDSLKIYISNEHNEKTNNIYSLLEKCTPKNTVLGDATFLIQYTEKKFSYFKDVFLKMDTLPKANYVFYKNTADIEEIASTSNCSDLENTYEFYERFRIQIKNYFKNPSSTENEILMDLRKLMRTLLQTT